MRILITGASGMLGSVLAKELSTHFDVFGTWTASCEAIPKYKKFNLQVNSYEELIEWANPNVIIHCAAITDVDYCESHIYDAFDVNSFSVEKLLSATTNDVKIIYISTDAIFSKENSPSCEDTSPSPASIYGKSKELWEFLLKKSKRKYFVIRTTIIWFGRGTRKPSFIEWIIESIKQNKKIKLFTDALFSPITIWDLTCEIDFLLKNHPNESGTLHISWNFSCSKYDFWVSFLKELWISYNDFIERQLLKDFSQSSNRSFNQILNCNFYQSKYNRSLPTLESTILSIKSHYYGEH